MRFASIFATLFAGSFSIFVGILAGTASALLIVLLNWATDFKPEDGSSKRRSED